MAIKQDALKFNLFSQTVKVFAEWLIADRPPERIANLAAYACYFYQTRVDKEWIELLENSLHTLCLGAWSARQVKEGADIPGNVKRAAELAATFAVNLAHDYCATPPVRAFEELTNEDILELCIDSARYEDERIPGFYEAAFTVECMTDSDSLPSSYVSNEEREEQGWRFMHGQVRAMVGM